MNSPWRGGGGCCGRSLRRRHVGRRHRSARARGTAGTLGTLDRPPSAPRPPRLRPLDRLGRRLRALGPPAASGRSGTGACGLLSGSRARPEAISTPAATSAASRPTFPHRTRRSSSGTAARRRSTAGPAASASAGCAAGRAGCFRYRPRADGRSLRPHAAGRPDRSRGAARRRDRGGRVADPAGRRRDRLQPRLGPAPAGVRDPPPPRGRVPALPVPGRPGPAGAPQRRASGSSTASCASASSR